MTPSAALIWLTPPSPGANTKPWREISSLALWRQAFRGTKWQKRNAWAVFRADIAVLDAGRCLACIEVKAPMTNHDGVRSKTRKDEHLPKDRKCLTAAAGEGATCLLELVVLIEAYGLSDGKRLPADGLSIRGYERAIHDKYGIKWPTRHDYQPAHGEEEVNEVEAELGFRRVAGWRRVSLQVGRDNVQAFADCAFFSLNPATALISAGAEAPVA